MKGVPMRNIIKLVLVSLVVVTATSAVAIKLRRSAVAKASKDSLIVHEWGTFTSIAGKDGVALEWRPLNGSTDLPKFVHTMQSATTGKSIEQEKFLFYRGVGTFDLPVAVTLENNRVSLRNSGKDPIGQLIVFENRDEKIGFQAIDNFSGVTTIDRPALDKNVDSV